MRTAGYILSLASFAGLFSSGLFGPLYAIFVEKIGGDVLDAGIAFGIFSILSGVFVMLVGRSDFFKRHLNELVLAGFALTTLGELAYLLVDSPTDLFIVQTVLGIAGGILEPSWSGLFSANKKESEAAEAWAMWNGGGDIVSGVAAIAGGFIVAMYSFAVLFLLMAAFNMASILIALRLMKKEKISGN